MASRYASCTVADKTAPQRVIRSAQKIPNTELPSLEDMCMTRCLCPATNIIKDSSRAALREALPAHQHSHFQITEQFSSIGDQRFELQKTCSKRCKRKHFGHKVNWLTFLLYDFSWVSSDLMMHELCVNCVNFIDLIHTQWLASPFCPSLRCVVCVPATLSPFFVSSKFYQVDHKHDLYGGCLLLIM